MRVLATRRNDVDRNAAAVGGCVVSWSAVQCLTQHLLCVVVLGVLVVIVAGSRPVVLFEPGC